MSKKAGSSPDDYVCLRMEDEASASHQNVVAVLRGFTVSEYSGTACARNPHIIALRLDESLHCIDLALYKVLCLPC